MSKEKKLSNTIMAKKWGLDILNNLLFGYEDIFHLYSIFVQSTIINNFDYAPEHTRPIFMAIAKFAYFKLRPKLQL
ncbi:hypothetical protein BCY89_17225 [Sphingobacterium siyangense]|uniref:Uncharacterized protein n=1 Tax=Sphingobacterium siyangense TaxID=459529 RepID=A0A420FFX0_9SPHI|nr:hypothetical protein BCY89_17225 [Sphingobacterium siyangense]